MWIARFVLIDLIVLIVLIAFIEVLTNRCLGFPLTRWQTPTVLAAG